MPSTTETPSIFFSYGFRPFFLLGSIYGVAVMSLFIFWIAVHHAGGYVVDLTISMAPFTWHAREMLFGFSIAIIAGFFLTAVPNWTGTAPVKGPMLILLTATWLVGRIAVGFSAYIPPIVVAVADLAMLPLLAFLVASAMFQKFSKRNFVFLPILAILFAANLLIHMEFLGLMEDGVSMGLGLALSTIILLITIVGGRVVPAFTTNALRNQGESKLPINFMPLNIMGIGLVAALLIADMIDPDHIITGWIALAAAATNALRLALWQGYRVLAHPILWVLHLGFAWLVVGLAAKGIAVLHPGFGAQTALHALTAGAIGTMTIAVMSRAALGHTGRPLIVSNWVVLSYILVSFGAAIRVIVPVWLPAYYNEGMLLSGVAWTSALALFVIIYWPILTGPPKGAKS